MNNDYNQNNGYMPPQNGQNGYMPPEMNNAGASNASVSKTLGIIGLVSSVVCCCLPIVGLVLGILAVVFSGKSTRANGGFVHPSATVGKTCGIIAIVLCSLFLCADLVSMVSGLSDQYIEEFYKYYSGAYT